MAGSDSGGQSDWAGQSDSDEGASAPELDPNGLLAELLGVPDRDRCPGARPMVSVSSTDEAEYRDEVSQHAVAAPLLRRRGVDHGQLAELDDTFAFVPRDPLAALETRWAAAKPIVLHDAVPPEAVELGADVRRGTAHWGPELRTPEGLDRFLASRSHQLANGFALTASDGRQPTDERDIASQTLETSAATGTAALSGLWVKTQRLSTYATDASVRLRLSFGDEVTDDASRDAARHHAVSQLATRLFAEAAVIQADDELPGLIGEWIGGPPLLTQGIAYWNAPDGGALFHHDAFDEPLAGRQRGVLYAQVTGSTVWLALSLRDLGARVAEFLELVDDGTLEGARLTLEAAGIDFDQLGKLARRSDRLEHELALPGCGAFAAVVNHGPEFTALLADAGHAYRLGPGDAIVLPNHGIGSTCMHSVLCASDEPAFSLSLAIRDRRARGAGNSPGNGRRRGGPRRRRGGRGRGRPSSGRGPRSSRGRG